MEKRGRKLQIELEHPEQVDEAVHGPVAQKCSSPNAKTGLQLCRHTKISPSQHAKVQHY